MAEDINNSLFSNEVLDAVEASSIRSKEKVGPVTVLGRTFANDEERRSFFREELRKKLPELKRIEGFPKGDDDSIVALSDPPYYTACPNPWLNDFIDSWEKEKKQLLVEGKRSVKKEVTEPYASDVSEGKNNPVYNAHTYHTKCPYPAIVRYIDYYTQPGDIILDGFSGTGMTGVAAHLSHGENGLVSDGHRHCICSDLSVIASLVAANNCHSVDAARFIKEANDVYNAVYNECSWMYQTRHSKTLMGEIETVVWSDVFVCNHCNHDIVFYDCACDKKTGHVHDSFTCPYCGATLTKKGLPRSKETLFDENTGKTLTVAKTAPVLIEYRFQGKTYTKELDEYDRALIERIEKLPIPYWIPVDELSDGCKTSEPKKTNGLCYVYQFYSKRNLYILASMLDKIGDRNYLKTWFTSQLVNISKQNRYRPDVSFPYNPLNGTLYVGSLVCESNVFSAYKNKIRKIGNALELLDLNDNVACIQSATKLNIKDESIDYIFIDPPFGANIMYSELNEIWESWLKVKTNDKEEAIISPVQNKDLAEYSGLMLDSMREFYRVLKPGSWMTIEFSNTKASVWNSIQTALQASGFIVVNVASLDKQQGSYNAVTSSTAVKQDLVITCFKPTSELVAKVSSWGAGNDDSTVWDFVEEYLMHLPVHLERGSKTTTVVERSPKILYDRLISYFVPKGLPVPMDASDFQNGLRERFEENDGMFFTPAQLNEYLEKKKLAPEFVPMGLIVSNEADGIEWLRNQLREKPQTYQDIQPGWMQAINGIRKGDILPELSELLEQNFIQEADGSWRLPNIQDDVDKDRLREKALLKEFKIYVEAANKPHARIKEVRVEAIRAGFKKCYMDKDFATIVMVGDKIPQNLLTEDDILLQFYDIARTRV